MLIRCLLAILSMPPAYTFANEGSSSNPIEDLLRLKQQLVLEHMAGDGETPLQRELKKQLNHRQTKTSPSSKPNSQLNPEQQMNHQLCAFWKQQSESDRRIQKLEQYCP